MTYKIFRSLAVCLLAPFTLLNLPLQAQFPGFAYCPAGVQADGFIDWTQLPAPPTPSRNGPNDPIEATLPVTGIPGLTATVHIPIANMTPGEPPYQISNSTDLTLSLQDGATPITLTFNRPVRGVRAVVRVRGRFGYKMTVIANNTGNSGGTPPPGEVDISGFDFPGFQAKVAPLNILSRKNDLTTLSFAGQSGEIFYFDLVNVRVQSADFDLASTVPVSGLVQWLRPDEGTYFAPPPVLPPKIETLTDRSGAGNNAASADVESAPLLDYDGEHCTPVAVFNAGETLHANLPISGLTGMTVFVAAAASADESRFPQYGENAAISWQENQSWGETFVTPLQSRVYFRFGTTQTGNMPRYRRPLHIGGDFTITSVVHDESVDSLYVNGQRVLRQPGKNTALSGIGSVETIGAGYNGTFFKGKIGEILVYNRALSNKERNAVEHYLKVKYGAF